MDIAEKVKEIVSDKLDVDPADIEEDKDFVEDLKADSLAIVEVVLVSGNRHGDMRALVRLDGRTALSLAFSAADRGFPSAQGGAVRLCYRGMRLRRRPRTTGQRPSVTVPRPTWVEHLGGDRCLESNRGPACG